MDDRVPSLGQLIGNNSKTTRRMPESGQMVLGKIQPQATDLEEAVLGALMLEKEALSQVIDILTRGFLCRSESTHFRGYSSPL